MFFYLKENFRESTCFRQVCCREMGKRNLFGDEEKRKEGRKEGSTAEQPGVEGLRRGPPGLGQPSAGGKSFSIQLQEEPEVRLRETTMKAPCPRSSQGIDSSGSWKERRVKRMGRPQLLEELGALSCHLASWNPRGLFISTPFGAWRPREPCGQKGLRPFDDPFDANQQLTHPRD